ncbi:hypothetical protein [Salinibaculum rarum]|uniref:hypothetical protein n=1 Tax=Salinibaculum rarum TaxID=3058903 RepID=UPI00265DB07C|nr:hypothetical protein [Salinibaculum sp. KK48]
MLPGDSVTRHDLLLAAIALPLVVAGMAGALLPVGMSVALGAGSVPATGTMGYALFYRPPGRHETA